MYQYEKKNYENTTTKDRPLSSSLSKNHANFVKWVYMMKYIIIDSNCLLLVDNPH